MHTCCLNTLRDTWEHNRKGNGTGDADDRFHLRKTDINNDWQNTFNPNIETTVQIANEGIHFNSNLMKSCFDGTIFTDSNYEMAKPIREGTVFSV